MCLAVPGMIEAIIEEEGALRMADVNFAGIKKRVSIAFLGDEIRLGDYVIVHAGVAINKIDEEEALKVLGYLREWEDLENEFSEKYNKE